MDATLKALKLIGERAEGLPENMSLLLHPTKDFLVLELCKRIDANMTLAPRHGLSWQEIADANFDILSETLDRLLSKPGMMV
jgi:hypothetical protein